MKIISLILALLLTLSGCRGTAAAPGQDPTRQQITPEQAQSIALENAGLTADQVTRLRAEPDRDDRISHYDVEFHYQGFEYDYEIDAASGTILKAEKDRNN